MPEYLYQCKTCGKTITKVNKIADYKEGGECCGEKRVQIIEPPMINPFILGGGTYDGYKCPITNEWVTSKKRRNEIMKENNLVEAGDAKPIPPKE